MAISLAPSLPGSRLGRKDGTKQYPAVARLVDLAVGELLRMHARIGHADRLTELFAEVEGRTVTGPATEALTGAKEGL